MSPKHGFGHTYKVSTWNSQKTNDFCNIQILREYFGEFMTQYRNTPLGISCGSRLPGIQPTIHRASAVTQHHKHVTHLPHSQYGLCRQTGHPKYFCQCHQWKKAQYLAHCVKLILNYHKLMCIVDFICRLWHKTVVTPMGQQWSYHSLALSQHHKYLTHLSHNRYGLCTHTGHPKLFCQCRQWKELAIQLNLWSQYWIMISFYTLQTVSIA